MPLFFVSFTHSLLAFKLATCDTSCMEENTYQQIQAIIDASRLGDIEKREFGEVFARTKEDALAPILALFEKDPSWVLKLYENYCQKKEAVVTGSMDAWKDVIQKEKEELEHA